MDPKAILLGSPAGFFIKENMVRWYLEKHPKGGPSGLGEPVLLHLEWADGSQDQGDDIHIHGGQNARFAKIQGVEKEEKIRIVTIESDSKSRMCTFRLFLL